MESYIPTFSTRTTLVVTVVAFGFDGPVNYNVAADGDSEASARSSGFRVIVSVWRAAVGGYAPVDCNVAGHVDDQRAATTAVAAASGADFTAGVDDQIAGHSQATGRRTELERSRSSHDEVRRSPACRVAREDNGQAS